MNTQLSKLPPRNIEAEEAVIGSLLIDPDAIFDVSGFLKPEMFSQTVNQWIFEAIVEINSKNNPIDVIAIGEVLRRLDRLEDVGGESHLIGLVGSVPNSVNVETYGRIVEAAAGRRELLAVAGKVASLAYDETMSYTEALDRANSTLFNVSTDQAGKDVQPIADVMDRYLDHVENIYATDGPVGISTGFVDLDKVFNFRDSELTVLAARPGMGKTSLQIGKALNMARSGKSVAMFNLEMSDTQLVHRMVSAISGIDIGTLLNANMNEFQWPAFHDAFAELKGLPIFMDDHPGLSPVQLRTKCRKLHIRHGIDIVMVDYLQLMQGDQNHGANRVNEVGEISRSLKILAKELDIPVLALAQLSRGVESRMDKRPMLSDLRGSGSIEQDADNVIFIYRDDYYFPDTSEEPNVAEINVAKQRNGPTDTTKLYWSGSNAKFSNLSRNDVDLNNL